MCNGFDILFQSLSAFGDDHDYVVEAVYVIQALVVAGGEAQACVATAQRIMQLIDLRKKHIESDELAQWILAALGYVARDYG